MFLSSLFSGYKKQKKYYFGLFLKGDQAVGMVFEVVDNNLIILDRETSTYSNGWENITEDIDDLIFKLESKTKQHLKEVIFFTYAYFIEEKTNEIKQPYKDIIKNLLKKLELKPLGYIECFEAVASYLGRRDNIPLNAILIELDKHNVDVCVYKSGHRMFAKNSSRTNNLIEDLLSVFEVLKGQVLPSRIVLYDAADLHNESTKIISHKWDEDIFIQPPRVEVVKEDKLYKELGEIFAEQLFDNAGEGASRAQPSMAVDEATPQDEQEKVANDDESVEEEATGDSPPPDAAAVMGFMIGRDVANAARAVERPVETEQPRAAYNVDSQETDFSPSEQPKKRFTFPSFHMPHIKTPGFFKYAWILGVIMIIAALFSIEYYFHKAKLTILLPAKSLSKKFDFAVDTASGSGTGPEIKTGTYTTAVDDSLATSGKRDLGEKARGEVTLHNFSDSGKLIQKGTTVSVDGKSFVLDQDVNIASASESIVDGGLVKQPGKAKGVVVASVLGPEGNIAKGKRFSIADLPSSTYFGINESAFSGGTRKSIKTVSRDDIDTLKKNALNKAKKDSTDGIAKQLAKSDKVIDTLMDATLADVTLSKELGEEADEVTLSGHVSITYYYLNSDEFKKKLADGMKSDAPADFQVVASKLTYTLNDVKKADTKITFSANAQTVSVKELATDTVLSKVVGRKKSDLDAVLRGEEGISGYNVNIQSPVMLLDKWMPFFRKNIELDTSTL